MGLAVFLGSLSLERLLFHSAGERSHVADVRVTGPESESTNSNVTSVRTLIGGHGRQLSRYSLPVVGAQAYVRAEDSTIYYVEEDARHLVAIASDGTVLWREDPFTQAKLESYRFERPRISRLGDPAPWMLIGRAGDYIAIQLESTQFGIVDVATGEFIYLGRD